MNNLVFVDVQATGESRIDELFSGPQQDWKDFIQDRDIWNIIKDENFNLLVEE